MAKTIRDIVAGLSDEERELHADLIAECEGRESEIEDGRVRSVELARRLRESQESLANSLRRAHQKANELLDSTLALEAVVRGRGKDRPKA